MTDLRAAAQQALEALELAQTDVHWELNSPTRKFLRKAEKTLRAALAQQDEPVEQAAWRLWDEDPQGGGDWRYYDAKDFKEGIDPMKYFDGLVPLYTAPPQRKPLTEEEIDAEWRELDGEASALFKRVLRKFARAIERRTWNRGNQMSDLREAAQQAEKLDQMVDRLWSQMRYAYEHGGGHSGHLNNAWHTAMLLSKELRRLNGTIDELNDMQIGLRNELRTYREREKTMGWNQK